MKTIFHNIDIKAELLNHTPVNVCSHAIRTCWNSFEKSDNGGESDRALIDRVGNKFKHSSTLEHLVMTFYIKGFSRAALQEISRHRMASLSVKSSRYTLKELKNEESFVRVSKEKETGRNFTFLARNRARKYLVPTEKEEVNDMAIYALENLRHLLVEGYSNDIVKYALPESYKTEMTWTINMRSLQNFLSLRLDKAALWEIQDFAIAVIRAMPKEYLYLIKDIVLEKAKNNLRLEEIKSYIGG